MLSKYALHLSENISQAKWLYMSRMWTLIQLSYTQVMDHYFTMRIDPYHMSIYDILKLISNDKYASIMVQEYV
ncbi:Diels-Alderase fsa2 [Dirofilaria immitis]